MEVDLDPVQRGDRLTLVELTSDGREVILFDRQGGQPAVNASDATASAVASLNGTNATNATCGSEPCNSSAPATDGQTNLVVAARFGSTILARYQVSSRSVGRGFNLTYGYLSRLALLRQRGNSTLLQLALALLEAQGANASSFGWHRPANELSFPDPAGAASLGNVTDAEGCFLCFYYNGSCHGASACGAAGCYSKTGEQIASAVEGGPIPPPWSAQPPGPADVGADGPLFYRFSSSLSASELPDVVSYMGYRPMHYVRTERVSAYPPGTVKAPFSAVLGERPMWGPYGDMDPSTVNSHPQRAAVGWGLIPVLYGYGDQLEFEQLKYDLFGADGEFPGQGASQPDWQVLVPAALLTFSSVRRWSYDLDSSWVPPFSFVDEDRRLVVANELAMFVPCGAAVNNTCGVSCLVTGTALNLLQCGVAVAVTPCNEPVVDKCNNECGLTGTYLCNSSASDAGALRLGSLYDSTSSATFQLTSNYDADTGTSSLYLSYYDPSQNCNPIIGGFNPETSACYYTEHGSNMKIAYRLSSEQLLILASKVAFSLPIPTECPGRSQLCKFNDPLDLTPGSVSVWKIDGQTANASVPWWEEGSPGKSATWADLRAIVANDPNDQILEVLYIEDMAGCMNRCIVTYAASDTVCRSHCLVNLAASLMLTFGADGTSLQPCSLNSAQGNIQSKATPWPTGTVTFPPNGSWPVLDILCLSFTCIDFFPNCYVSINAMIEMKTMFEARRKTMMREVYNRPGFNIVKFQRLSNGQSGIDIANPSNIAANKPQGRVENTFRISFQQQTYEKDILIGRGQASSILFEGIVDKFCPFTFNPTLDGFRLQLCYRNSTGYLSNLSSLRQNRTITIPDVSGRIVTTSNLEELTSIPGLRKRKYLTPAGTVYPRYGIWPLPRYSKVPNPFSQGNFLTEVTHNIRPLQGLGPRYCKTREDGTPILCDNLQQEYDPLEDSVDVGDESLIFTGSTRIFSESSPNQIQNATTSILFEDPSQHQKITFPDVTALLISDGNLRNITETGVLASPLVANSSESTWTRLKFGVGWESVNVSEKNNFLEYRYTQGTYSFCRSGNSIPRLLSSNVLVITNFMMCNQSDAILFDMGTDWDTELTRYEAGQCFSMYLAEDNNTNAMPELNSIITLNSRGVRNLFNVTEIYSICQNNLLGLNTEPCAGPSSRISFMNPGTQASIVIFGSHRYVLCALESITDFAQPASGTWSVTRNRVLNLPVGIYSLENVTGALNSMLMEELVHSNTRLEFNIREPNEGLCGERPAGTTYNFSLFHCAPASRYIELHGQVVPIVECNFTSVCNSLNLASCNVVCLNITDANSNIQVLNSSTILDALGIPKPIFAYTFGLLSFESGRMNGTMQPVAPGSGYITSGYGRKSGFGLGGSSWWDGFIPQNASDMFVPYTAWCQDGLLGYLCNSELSGCNCQHVIITFSRVLGSTKTRTGVAPVNNTLLIPRTSDGLLISTGNLEDVHINSSAVTSLHVNALRQFQTAVGALIEQHLQFQNPPMYTSNQLFAESGFQLQNSLIALHSHQHMLTWVAIYSPDGQCPSTLFTALDLNDTETIWAILENKTFCANRTFSSLQDNFSRNASKFACFAYCNKVDNSKIQENIAAQSVLAILVDEASDTVDGLLEDPTPYCVSVRCNGTKTSTPNMTIPYYLYGPGQGSQASTDPYSAALASRKSCTVVCTSRVACATEVQKYLTHRPPPYNFSNLATLQGWDMCVRMIQLESKFSPALAPYAQSSRASFQNFANNFPEDMSRADQAEFALQQPCSCVELAGYSAATSNGLLDVLNHSCQTNTNPVCISDGPLKRFPDGLPWRTRLNFDENIENSFKFLVLPFVSAIMLSNMNLEDITVESGAMTSLAVQKQVYFNSSIKIGVVREGIRSKATSQGSRVLDVANNDEELLYGPFYECAGCITAGTCISVCSSALNELVLDDDALLMFSKISGTGAENASSIRASIGSSATYQIRFPTWDSDLCNQKISASCAPRSKSNLASFTGTIITTGNLEDVTELYPNQLQMVGATSGTPAIFSGSVELGSQFSCISGNTSGYTGRGWSIFAGAGCADPSLEGNSVYGLSVQQCKQLCESDAQCGILLVSKSMDNGLNRSGGQVCTLIPFPASHCSVVSQYNQDLYLNFREAPLPWSTSQASNQFFNRICENSNLTFVPGTPISLDGFLSSGITWKPQQPYTWRYFPDSTCDSFHPTSAIESRDYIQMYQNVSNIDFCKSKCLLLTACGMVSVEKTARQCYLLPAVVDRRYLVNGSEACGGRESLSNPAMDGTATLCILQGPCTIIQNQRMDLYVYIRDQGVSITFFPPSQQQTVIFPDASGVVITTGNLYDVSAVEGLQGSDVINFTVPEFSLLSSNHSEFWIRYSGNGLQLRTFKTALSPDIPNYLQFSGSRVLSPRINGNVILRECDFTPSQTSLWKVADPSFSVSGLPDRDCLGIAGCVLYTNIIDPSLLSEVRNSITQERESRPGLDAQPTSFRNTYSGTGPGFDSFSYTIDFSVPGSRVSNTTCLRTCAGGSPCDRAIGYLPCERGTLGCHSNCPGYLFPRPGIDSKSICAGNAEAGFVTGTACGCAGGAYYQAADGTTYGTSICVIPNMANPDYGRFCLQGSSTTVPTGWLPAALCCRNRSDVQNCGTCQEFPPIIPVGSNNRITFPDNSGTVITTGNMDDLTVLTLQLDNLVISGSLDLGIISQSTVPSFGPNGYHFDPSSGTNGIWRTAVNLDPYTTRILGGLPLVSGLGTPGHEYTDPISGASFFGSAQYYPLTLLINSPVSNLTGSTRHDVVLFCEDSIAFQKPPSADDADSSLDASERTEKSRCAWKREILLPSTSGLMLVDTALYDLPSLAIPRQNLLLQQLDIEGNITFGYRQNYSTDPVNFATFSSFPVYHGLGVLGLEKSIPQEVKPFDQPYESVLRAYSLIDGDIGLTLSSASDFPIDLPQSRGIQIISDYGENCVDAACTSFSTTFYGSPPPTAEIEKFATQGRSVDNHTRRFQDISVQLSSVYLSQIDIILRDFLRQGAPSLPFYVQIGEGILMPGEVYYDINTYERPRVQIQKTTVPFIPEKESSRSHDISILPETSNMLSETIVITEKLCYSIFLSGLVPRNVNGQVNRNSFYSLLIAQRVVVLDLTGSYSMNISALIEPANLDVSILLKCASLGYYPLWLQNYVTEILLPESNGYVLTTGSLEDISISYGNFTSLSVNEDVLVDGSLTIGSRIDLSTLTIYSNIDMSAGLQFSGPSNTNSVTNLGQSTAVDETYVFLPDVSGTLVVGDIPSTLGSFDVLEASNLNFESSVEMGSDSTIGGLGQNTVLTLYAALTDSCPLRFVASAEGEADITLCSKDPSGDNTIFLPDESGTLLTSSQLRELKNVTSLEKVSFSGKSVMMDCDVQIGGVSDGDTLELNANIMGLKALTFDGVEIRDGQTLVLSAGDPSAQNEITLPDCSGTIITTGNFPTAFEVLTIIDSFVAKGATRLTGENIKIGSSHLFPSSQVVILADLAGEYPLIFDGVAESTVSSLKATTSFAMQQIAGENIITFPDTSGLVITSANPPSAVYTDSLYTLSVEGFNVNSESVFLGSAIEPPTCLGCFLFADSLSTLNLPAIPGNNTFSVSACGGIYYFTGRSSAGNYIGASLLPNSGSWSYLSDRNTKKNIVGVNATDTFELLVEKVPISLWHYTEDPSKTLHMGPYAQDFYAAFHLGSDAQRIISSDADGIILGAIQGMHEMIEKIRIEKERLQTHIYRIHAQIESQNQNLVRQESQLKTNNVKINELLLMLGDYLPLT